MKLTPPLAALLFWLSLMLAAPVFAQSALPQCADFDMLADKLLSDYAESPLWMGGTATGEAIVVTGQEDGGSFTIIAVRPDGVGCIVAGGSGWEFSETEPADVEG